MANLSYSQAAQKALERERERVREKEREKELYSKGSVAQSINFVVDKAKGEFCLDCEEKFSLYLATILARDKENSDWLDEDIEYIDNITKYLKNISEIAPAISEDTERAFLEAVTCYCSTKLKYRLTKLNDTIKLHYRNEHVKSFEDLLSAKNDTNIITISGVCREYYKKVRYNNNIPTKFKEHIKKVGSYAVSVIGIVECARNVQYKSLFSNVEVYRAKPVIIKNQPIYSWKNIIRRFIDEDKYNRFMDGCSKKPEVMERISQVYTDKATQKQQPLDGDNVKQYIYLHAEMNILAFLIDNEIKSKVFIAVSKYCCYLCGLYIDLARKHGYRISFSGYHMKLYGRWILPHVKNKDFKAGSLKYILKCLDRIIKQKLNHDDTKSLSADPDSPGNSPDPDYSDGNYLYEYVGSFKVNNNNTYSFSRR
ncbi:uncharacterized protein OCT59_023298 [Rhizophagus irregularis]|nr:hypothetical protein OCT59_023298 [Rhizophagus irregularis]